MSRLSSFLLFAGLAIFAMGSGYAAYIWIDSLFAGYGLSVPREPVAHLPDGMLPGSLADILNVSYGLPVAVVGALTGVVVTVLGAIISTRQGDVELLKFVTESLKATSAEYTKIVAALEQLRRAGVRSFRMSEELLDELGRREDKTDNIQDAIESILKAPDRAAEAVEMNANLTSGSKTISIALKRISSDPYAESFGERQMNKLPLNHSPLEFIKTIGFPDICIPQRLLHRGMHDISINILEYANMTEDLHYIQSYSLTPVDVTAEEMAGHTIYWIGCELNSPRKTRHGDIVAYNINLGMAWLLTVVAMIPEKPTIRDFFGDLLGSRGAIVKRYLNLAGPDRSLFGAAQVLKPFLKALKTLDRLIIVRFGDGRSEFYSRDRHGDIPKHGYVKEGRPV